MSTSNGITPSSGSWTAPGRSTGPSDGSARATGGQQPAAPTRADSLSQRFGSVFRSTFAANMATVFDRASAGEFDSPEARFQEQAALAALTQRLNNRVGGAVVGGGPGVVAGGAPTLAVDDAATTDAAREVFTSRIHQSEARLANVNRSLAAEFPEAAKMASAATGTWDPATFVPKNEAEAEIFAQRMVIDATEAAARLEIVTTQLHAARFEASTAAPATAASAAALVAELEADVARQETYVDKLARIVDEASNGQVTDAGADARAGNSQRSAQDLSVEDFVASLRASGMSEEQITLVIGASELAVEEEKTPGGSPRLQQISTSMTSWAVQKMFDSLNQLREEGREAAVERQREQRKQDDRRAESRAEERRAETQQRNEAATQAAAARQARFDAWLAELAQRSRARRIA